MYRDLYNLQSVRFKKRWVQFEQLLNFSSSLMKKKKIQKKKEKNNLSVGDCSHLPFFSLHVFYV